MTSDMLKSSVSPTVQDMLRDAIKVLCQSAVRFEAQLSIQALIGITVDGSEVLLVDIRELIDKESIDDIGHSSMSNRQSTRVHGQPGIQDHANNMAYQASHPNAPHRRVHAKKSLRKLRHEGFQKGNVLPVTYSPGYDEHFGEIYHGGQTDHTVRNDQTDQSNNLQLREVCKQESMGDIQFCDGSGAMVLGVEYAGEDDANNTDDQFYELTTGIPSYAGDCNEFVSHDAVKNSYGDRDIKVEKNDSASLLPRRSVTMNQRRSRVGSINGYTSVRRKHVTTTTLSDAACTTDSAASTAKYDSSKMYTCELCGQTMRHKWSFVRHKRQHEGIMFRCDICGKLLNRSDKFKAHQRQCQAQLDVGSANFNDS